MDLVSVDKRLLQFALARAPAPGGMVSDTLVVRNESPADVAFKVKTTNQQRYIVRPNVGAIPPRGAVDIFIGMQPTHGAPAPGPSKDKFLLRVTPAPDAAAADLAHDFWAAREGDAAVADLKFRVEFVADEPPPVPDVVPVHAAAAVPHARDLPPSVAPREHVLGDPDVLLADGNYDDAIARVKELQALLDAKNLELARLKAELAETRAETDRVLKDAPKTPLSANKLLSDPFGGVSVAGFGLMLLLFLILVNVILRFV